MNIVVAPDSFKESLSAKQVTVSISEGILKIMPEANIIQVPISDGGEGLLDALVEVLHGKRISVRVKDPLLRNIEAEYGILGDGVTAVIEMAKASGLELLKDNEKNPMITSTFGTGQLILNALDCGCTKFIIGIGGSATNDGGMGMVKALGGKFLNENNKEIGNGGGALDQIFKIDLSNFDKRIRMSDIVVACDVSNPLTGKNGASFIYGAQKGATKDQIKKLDKNLIKYASVIRKDLDIEVETAKGAGAAGGMGAALLGFFDAHLINGIDLIINSLQVEKHIKNADLVITGEGKIDAQTLNGKTVFGIAAIGKKYNVPVIAIAGKVGDGIDEIYKQGVTAIFCILNQPMALKDAIDKADFLIRSCVENIIRTIDSNKMDRD